MINSYEAKLLEKDAHWQILLDNQQRSKQIDQLPLARQEQTNLARTQELDRRADELAQLQQQYSEASLKDKQEMKKLKDANDRLQKMVDSAAR